ncbi:MAG TPA: hypothetical protein VGD69_28455 [Herpetosiphonaceae bacterium]
MQRAMRRDAEKHALRPLGVWILTILNSIVAGVFPLLAVVAALGGNAAVPGTELTALLLAGLGIGVIGASVGTWQRSDTARGAAWAAGAVSRAYCAGLGAWPLGRDAPGD